MQSLYNEVHALGGGIISHTVSAYYTLRSCSGAPQSNIVVIDYHCVPGN